jgi:ribose transport system permease protein
MKIAERRGAGRTSDAPDRIRTAGAEPPAARPRPRYLDRHVLATHVSRYGLLVIWLLVIAVFSLIRPEVFFTASNFANIFGSQAVLLILTLGLLYPLTVGEFDASVAGVLSVSLMLLGYLNIQNGWPIVPGVLVVLAVGAFVGLVNSLVVVRLGVDSLVATLGMGTLLIGLSMGISNFGLTGVSQTLVDASRTKVLGVQLVFYYALVLTLASWYVFRFTPLGRYMHFTGASREVARLGGIRTDRLRTGAFVTSGVIASLAGVLLCGVLGGADPNTGASYLLPTFAAAFLGATAINPGRFNPWGAFIAVYFLITGITGLQTLGLSGWIEQVFYGAALVIAVTLSRIASLRLSRA